MTFFNASLDSLYWHFPGVWAGLTASTRHRHATTQAPHRVLRLPAHVCSSHQPHEISIIIPILLDPDPMFLTYELLSVCGQVSL